MPIIEPEPGNCIGHFKILERLGQGGMGTVYKAVDLKLDRQVALKFISPDLVKDSAAVSRFQREARLASQLLHPNIATIFEFDTSEEQHFIAMEFVPGQTVRQRMQGTPLGPEDLLELALGVAGGLAEAHKKGILHRDIKPGNVVFAENGGVKVLDFGLAKTVEAVAAPQESSIEERATEVATETGQLMGTYGYMPPEVLCGRPFLPASDVFSVGVLLYEAASGGNPFSGATPALVISAILNRHPAPPSSQAPGLDRKWDEIILRCLEKEPGKRYASAGELLEHIKLEFQDPRLAGLPQPQVARSSFFRWWHGAAAVAFILILAFLLTWLPQRTQAPEDAPAGRSPKLVVLPFRQIGPDSQARLNLAEGISEEIYARLSQVSGLRIIAPSAAMAYRDQQFSSSRIGSELGVDAALTGLVGQRADATGIQVALIDCRSGLQSWSRDFVVSPVLLDLNQVSAEIARSVVRSLGVPVQKPEEARLGRMPTADPEAYRQYREGRNLLSMYSKEAADQSILAFRHALKLDPHFAEAQAGISEAWFTMAAFGWGLPETAYAQAETAAKEALKMNPRVSDAHRMLANLYSMREARLDLAESHYRQAIEYEPSNVMALSWLAMEYAYQGRFKEALNEIAKARDLDPFSPLVVFYYGGIKYLSGDCLEAEIWAEKAIVDMKSRLALAHLLSAASHLCRNQVAEARLALEAGLRQPNGPTWALAAARMEGLLAVCDLRDNRRDAFLKSLAVMQSKYEKDHTYAYPLGVAFAADGNEGKALQWLQRAIEKRAFGWQEIRFDPFLEKLRSLPGFQALLLKLPIRPPEIPSSKPKTM